MRTLLILGATTVLRHVRNGARASMWMTALLARRPPKVAAVALANKMARIIWALLVKAATRGYAAKAQEPFALDSRLHPPV